MSSYHYIYDCALHYCDTRTHFDQSLSNLVYIYLQYKTSHASRRLLLLMFYFICFLFLTSENR